AFQIKGGSTTVHFHDNIVFGDGGADGLWIGGGTSDPFLHPSSAYEACNVTADKLLMHGILSAIHFVGGQGSRVMGLFAYDGHNQYVQAEASAMHPSPLQSSGDSVLSSVFDPAQNVVDANTLKGGAVTFDTSTDLPLTTQS